MYILYKGTNNKCDYYQLRYICQVNFVYRSKNSPQWTFSFEWNLSTSANNLHAYSFVGHTFYHFYFDQSKFWFLSQKYCGSDCTSWNQEKFKTGSENLRTNSRRIKDFLWSGFNVIWGHTEWVLFLLVFRT